MKLAEQHVIKKGDPRCGAIDAAAFASKNLYNQATYQIRQAYIHEGKYLPYAEVFHRVKHLDCYQALPRKVSNSILILIHKNWVSYFRAVEEWREHPEKFTGRAKDPRIQTERERTHYSALRSASHWQAGVQEDGQDCAVRLGD